MRNDRGQVVFEHRAEVTLTPVAFELYRALAHARRPGSMLWALSDTTAIELYRDANADGRLPDSDGGISALESAAELADFLGL